MPVRDTDPNGLNPFAAAAAGCALGAAASGTWSYWINRIRGDNPATAGKKAACAALAGCIQGGAIAAFPTLTSGCVAGAVANVAQAACEAALGVRGPLNPCDALNQITSTLVGCTGGAAAASGQLAKEIVGTLAGLDAQILGSLCEPPCKK